MMRISSLAIATAIAATFASAGCSMHDSTLPPLTASANAAPAEHVTKAGSTPILYVAEYGVDQIQVFDQAGTDQNPISTITSGLQGPEGIFVAPDEDFYVANSTGQDVAVFHKGAGSPYETLADTGEQPVGVTVDTNGTVFVSNYQDVGGDGGSGSVSVYAGGSTSPTSTLTVPNNYYVEWCTLDKTHDLYVGFYNIKAHKGEVDKFVNGTGPAHTTVFQIGAPGGMEFDAGQNLAIADELNTDIAIYKVGKAAPIQTIPCGDGLLDLTYNNGGNHVYASNYNGTLVAEYSFPAGALIDTISLQYGPTGIATDPARPF